MRNLIENYFDLIIIFIAIIVTVFICWPRNYIVTVDSVTWMSTVEISKLKTCDESGWFIPAGGRLRYSRREVRKYDDDDEPVYDTRYYYEIDRWCHERDVIEQGTDKKTYYGIVVFGENEREERRFMTYTITCITEKGKDLTLTVDEKDWRELRAGDHVKVKTQFGHVMKLEYIKGSEVDNGN